jgi:hypothetical protein
MRQAEQQEEIGSISTGRLPSGRHGLPREAVVRAQRDRLIESMIAVVAEIGYTEATVADVIRGQGSHGPPSTSSSPTGRTAS